MLPLFIKGLLIGLSIAAPVGPIGILCINRTLKGGLQSGLMSGLGAAAADAVYGCIAGFGLVALSSFLLEQQALIQMIGGAFLLYLGMKIFFSMAREHAPPDTANSLFEDFYSTFLLTLLNPVTILSFIAVFASFGIVDANANYAEAMIIVLGIFIGSMFWWGILSLGISSMHHRLSKMARRIIHVISGLILIAFGLLSLFGKQVGILI